ncbi:endo-1 4-beta-xylanase A [Striga asiatica]|uniref:Endo-1 4-beta-xylanase A n=1 Tax=Striga asiatica TaxID=4170 RepID=A0A5A7P0N7_STRAF|nr:endo-1 4-beta-xylanase A [Striga asiatica]
MNRRVHLAVHPATNVFNGYWTREAVIVKTVMTTVDRKTPVDSATTQNRIGMEVFVLANKIVDFEIGMMKYNRVIVVTMLCTVLHVDNKVGREIVTVVEDFRRKWRYPSRFSSLMQCCWTQTCETSYPFSIEP